MCEKKGGIIFKRNERNRAEKEGKEENKCGEEDVIVLEDFVLFFCEEEEDEEYEGEEEEGDKEVRKRRGIKRMSERISDAGRRVNQSIRSN